MSLRGALVMSAAAIALSGCMPRVDPGDRARTFIYLRSGGPNSLDPAVSASSGDAPIEQQVYEQLVTLDPSAPGLVTGQLASRWTVSDGGHAIDFEIEPGHRFSSGAPVDAAAVKFSLDRVKRVAKNPSSLLDWLQAVEVTGPMTVRLRLGRPFSPAVQMLTQAAASIVDPSQVRAHDKGDDGVDWLSEHSAGSGPYRVAEARLSERVTLAPNPFAKQPPSFFRRVDYVMLPDEGVRRLLLERGDGDLSDNISAAFVSRYRALPGVSVQMAPGGTSISYLVLNTRRGAFADVRLRRAVAAAVDYRGLRADVLKGNATQMAGYINAGAAGYDPSEPPPRRDLALARRLVSEAGYDGRPLRLVIGQIGPVSEFLQSNLADAGLNVQLERRSGGATQAARKNGDFDLIYDGWYTDTPDAGGMFEGLYASRSIDAGLNASGYSNPEVDALIDAALAEQDLTKRAEIFKRIDVLLRRDKPLVMIFAATPVVAYRSDVTGLTLNPLRPYVIRTDRLGRSARR